MKSEWFDPHKSFLSLGVVWVTVGSLLSMSIVSASVIIKNSELTVDLSFNGFNQFISIFRFPLGIAALIIPMVALLAANHRSEQTKEQISVTNAQNVFSNYYKHIEEFAKYLSVVSNKGIDSRYAHNKIYPNASKGDYSIDGNIVLLLSEMNNLIYDILKYFPSDINDPFNDDIARKYYVLIHKIYSYIYRDRSGYKNLMHHLQKNNISDTYLFRAKNLIKNSQTVIENINMVCMFSIDFVNPVNKLDSETLDMDAIYVTNNIHAANIGRNPQTFEQANEVFLEMLKKSVNSD